MDTYAKYMVALTWQQTRGRISEKTYENIYKDATNKLCKTLNKCKREVKTLILTPNKTEMCGMYQLAKDLAKDLKGDIRTKADINEVKWQDYDEVITMLYPIHLYGKVAQRQGVKWICYDQGIPPVTKTYFPNFWRRQAMKYISWRNNVTKKGADEYWDVTEREQKPRWSKKVLLPKYYEGVKIILRGTDVTKPYSIYIGRTMDYKNYEWLQETMNNLGIKLILPENEPDEVIHILLSNAKMLVTASLWEGYGRPVMEAEALGIPAVAYDVGTHKKHIKKGVCVPLGDEKAFKKAVLEVWNR